MRYKAGRTALALAFGEHPGQCCGVRYGADKAFFRASVLPFLDEQAVGKGRNVTVIHEFNVGFDLSGINRNVPHQAALVAQMVEETESRANADLERTLDAGRMPERYRDWLDWGYLERIVEINQAHPGRVHNRIEPLSDSTVWLMWAQTLLGDRFRARPTFEEKVELEIDIIRHSIAICLERSRRVVALVKEIHANDPGTAVVVPRGWAHKGMAGDFDFSEFEITMAAGLKGVPHFSSEAIAESFSRKLGDDELERYALLSLRYNEYMGKHGCRIHGGLRNPESVPVERIWEVSAEARRYALEAVGDALMPLAAALP